MAKKWDIEARELYTRGEITTFRAILAVVDKKPFSFTIGISPKRFKGLVANPAQFTFDDAYRIAAFLKGNEKATAADEKIIVNLIHDYSAEVRCRLQKDGKKSD
ncbi:MAG: hypothetical protein BGO55_08465 [Sphingobacteriales bacterium 50-39]|nr:hypothetical protein [Sphingobacteriales bacterium]OJW59296.1 MAG: hypothetical protein BGO55_08465 [Sphingobacteriales bacterium 50-39]